MLRQKKSVLVAVPRPLASLVGLVQERRRWDWVARNTAQLNHDSYAAEEVARQLSTSTRILQERIRGYVGLRELSGTNELSWFCRGKKLDITSGRALMSYLSRICDKVFHAAPVVRNELINRRTPSSAAVAARTRLIERMFANANEPLLGMDPSRKPPEMSIYLSLLEAGGVHRVSKGRHQINEPLASRDPCRLRPALHEMLSLLEVHGEAKVRVSEVFSALREPPYGIRDGLHPLLLAILATSHEHELAFYEDGAFMRQVVGSDFRRITKAPETFEIQLCRLSGVRSALFRRLAELLDVCSVRDQKLEVLDVVRPLCSFAAELPPYTRNTSRLSKMALSVRDVLTSAQEPALMLFRDLPAACALAPFGARRSGRDGKRVQTYVGALRSSLGELRAAYPDLLGRLRDNVLAKLQVEGPLDAARSSLASAAKALLVAVRDPDLKTLCHRFADTALPDSEWLESLGSLVCAKPPSKWIGSDEEVFLGKFGYLAERFRQTEGLVFPAQRAGQGKALRVSITQQDGSEVDRVIRLAAGDEEEAKTLEAVFSELLDKGGSAALAAASYAMWKKLRERH